MAGDHVQWSKCEYTTQEKIEGRYLHSALEYKGSVVLFGGCTMFNKKRMQRECINQVLVFNPNKKTLGIVKSSGISVSPRRSHSAAIFSKAPVWHRLGKFMVVYGGYLENGSITDELLSFNLDNLSWSRIYVQRPIEGFAQATAVSIAAKPGN